LAITVSHPDMATSFQARGSKIFPLECDVRARARTVVVTVIGDERQSIWN
jgi:hypothetical protein